VKLRKELQSALCPCAFSNYIIAIPVREIESWLLCDSLAIKNALNLPSQPNEVPNPESILDPKKRLRDVVRTASGKRIQYLNTAHNYKIAAESRIDKLRRCESFLALEQFLVRVV
jgi:hypothetical protein